MYQWRRASRLLYMCDVHRLSTVRLFSRYRRWKEPASSAKSTVRARPCLASFPGLYMSLTGAIFLETPRCTRLAKPRRRVSRSYLDSCSAASGLLQLLCLLGSQCFGPKLEGRSRGLGHICNQHRRLPYMKFLGKRLVCTVPTHRTIWTHRLSCSAHKAAR